MRTFLKWLKKWWKELLIIITFIALGIWGNNIEKILDQYNATTPVAFWLVTEVLWNLSILVFIYQWKGKRFILDFIQGKGLITSLKQFGKISKENKPRQNAWFWFRVNRIVALIQPFVTALMVMHTSMPAPIKWSIAAFLVADFLHTIFVIVRSRQWQTSD